MSETALSRSARLDALSREISLKIDRRGRVTWSDERARNALGASDGVRLVERAVPGTESKVDRLVDETNAHPVARFEISLVVNDRPTTWAFRGEPDGEGAILVGLHLTDDEAATFGSVQATLGEITELHRKAERDRKDLADSNLALVAMHAEIDDKNAAIRRAADVKSRVVSNVSHEFRTPINSILGITQLLLDRLDGPLTEEQETQLRFVKSSAEALSDLVNDLLDLSRIEAGRHDLRVVDMTLTDLFSSLRGMMKPLVSSDDVALVIEEPPKALAISTDAGKLSQILRNLVSNALKFTQHGEVRVRAMAASDTTARFEVSDTGIGIAEEDLDRVFEEFSQIDSPIQRTVRGTGLGLSLSRRFAEFLGGKLTVASKVGKGSTFTLEIPIVHPEIAAVAEIVKKAETIDSSKTQVLVVEDNRQTLFLYERYLSNAGFQVIAARTLDEAAQALERVTPAAIVLDVVLEGESTWGFLQRLKEDPAKQDIPVMVVTVVDKAQQARALGADEFWLKPIDGERLIKKLSLLAKRGRSTRVLVIDDDAASRYLIRKLLSDEPYSVLEADTAKAGVKIARERKPDVILLDFVLGKDTAFDVIDDLKADPDTRMIPIVLQTAKSLDEVEKSRLERETSSIVKKESLSREVAITRIREALEAKGLRAREKRLA